MHPDYSFVPFWKPPFLTDLTAEDRCHLNGLAVVGGCPQYVTALGDTNTAAGWRLNKPHDGCVIDVPSGALVAHGLSMSHSPRWHDGRQWLLNRAPAACCCWTLPPAETLSSPADEWLVPI